MEMQEEDATEVATAVLASIAPRHAPAPALAPVLATLICLTVSSAALALVTLPVLFLAHHTILAQSMSLSPEIHLFRFPIKSLTPYLFQSLRQSLMYHLSLSLFQSQQLQSLYQSLNQYLIQSHLFRSISRSLISTVLISMTFLP